MDSPMESVKKSTKKPVGNNKCFPLPDFSNDVQPLLNGDTLSEENRAKLSSKLKNELVAFLDHKKLLLTGNSGILRWQYRNLGNALAIKYPKMLWDLPSEKKKKFTKHEAPVYAVFIRRLSQRRKMHRLRVRRRVCELHFEPNAIVREASAYDPKTGRTLTAPLSIRRLQKDAVPTLRLTPPEHIVKWEGIEEKPAYGNDHCKAKSLNDETGGSQLAKLSQTDSGSESENVIQPTILIKQEPVESNDAWPSRVIDNIIYAEELVPPSSNDPPTSNLPSSNSPRTSNRTLFINTSSPENALPVANSDSTNVDESSVRNETEKKRKIDDVYSEVNNSTSNATVIKLQLLEKPSTPPESDSSSSPPSKRKKSAKRTMPSSGETREIIETLMNSSENNPLFETRTKERPNDLFDVFADFIADKLREMNWDNCAFALRSILDIVFKAGQVQQSSGDEDTSDISEPVSPLEQT